MQGLICQSQGITSTHCFMWLKWLRAALLASHTCSMWKAWNTVWVRASSYWPTQIALEGGEMGKAARQWKETPNSFWKTCLKKSSDFCHTETKRPLLPWSLHSCRICIKHCLKPAASHPSFQPPSRNYTGALQLAMAEGQWQGSYLALISWPLSI